jgi:hypothetical protein
VLNCDVDAAAAPIADAATVGDAVAVSVGSLSTWSPTHRLICPILTAMHEEWTEADEKQIELLRACTPERRVQIAMALTAMTRRLTWQAIEIAHPDWTDLQLRVGFVAALYGDDLAEAYRQRMAR